MRPKTSLATFEGVLATHGLKTPGIGDRREYLFTDDSLTITRTYTQNLLMFVPTPNKMYCCVLTNVVLVYITIIWPIYMLTPEHN
jgi:hypothetical protein